MRHGLYFDISNDEYHADWTSISNSGLGNILQSPYHYWSKHLDPARPKPEPTGPQDDGTIAHCAILEPDRFHERYVVGPDLNRSTKAWKEFCEIHDGKTVIKPEQYNRAMRQRDAVWKLPEVAKALGNGKAEVSAYWTDPETAAACRCRPDFAHEADNGVVLLDVKTYTDARPAEFYRQAGRMGYHRQDAFYSDGYALAAGLPVLGFIIVCVEMPWPHAACAMMLDPDSKEAGRRQYRRALDLYAECVVSSHWPSYPTDIEIIRIPEWTME